MKTVPLHGAKAAGRVVLVDDEDYDLVMQYRWHVQERTGPGRRDGPYAQAHTYRPDGRRTVIRMHRLIMGCAADVDHRNGNGLDNTRSNLRPATNRQNLGNQQKNVGSNRYEGVTHKRSRGKWQAAIQVDGHWRWLGYYTSEEAAARAYDAAALEAWGEFARLNFPSGEGVA